MNNLNTCLENIFMNSGLHIDSSIISNWIEQEIIELDCDDGIITINDSISENNQKYNIEYKIYVCNYFDSDGDISNKEISLVSVDINGCIVYKNC